MQIGYALVWTWVTFTQARQGSLIPNLNAN